MIASFVEIFCRVVIALTFALSAGGKALDLSSFEAAVADFRLLPRRLSRIAARLFLVVELAIVALMIAGRSLVLIGFLLAAGLLILFTAALLVVLHRNMTVACNCFGRTEQRVSVYDVARNVLLVGCGLIGAWSFYSSPPSPSAGEIVLGGLMAGYAVVLVTHLADIVETLRQPFHV